MVRKPFRPGLAVQADQHCGKPNTKHDKDKDDKDNVEVKLDAGSCGLGDT